MSVYYLASPYTHENPAIRLERFNEVNRAAAHLIEKGYVVFSPISMTHPIDLVLSDEGATMGSNYWVKFDEAFMDFCDAMIILELPGWQNSRGIARERLFFESRNRPIYFYNEFIARGT